MITLYSLSNIDTNRGRIWLPTASVIAGGRAYINYDAHLRWTSVTLGRNIFDIANVSLKRISHRIPDEAYQTTDDTHLFTTLKQRWHAKKAQRQLRCQTRVAIFHDELIHIVHTIKN